MLPYPRVVRHYEIQYNSILLEIQYKDCYIWLINDKDDEEITNLYLI